MNEGLIPRRYAKALYKVALERRCDGSLYQTMAVLSRSFREHPELQEAVANPFVPAAQKTALLLTAAGNPGEDALTGDFLKLLIRNKRIAAMRDIALAYQEIYRKANRIYVVNVTSAAPLTPEETGRLEALISRHLPEGSTVEMETATDPSLIGGFTVSIDNERLDASIKNELKQLRLKLLSK